MKVDLPLVKEGTKADEAFRKLVKSGRSALAVEHGGGILVVTAEALHRELAGKPDNVGALAKKSPRVPARPTGTAGRNKIEVEIDDAALFEAFRLAVGTHKCTARAKRHTYYDWDLPTLRTDADGNYLCRVDGTIVV